MKKINEDRQYVGKMILENDDFAHFALCVVLEGQTPYERRKRRTIRRNGRGFNYPDARVFTAMAEAACKRGHLTLAELATCRRLNKHGLPVLAKYWRQIQAAPGADQFVVHIPRKPPASEIGAQNQEEKTA